VRGVKCYLHRQRHHIRVDATAFEPDADLRLRISIADRDLAVRIVGASAAKSAGAALESTPERVARVSTCHGSFRLRDAH
jgi:hypothetical protein